MKILVAMSGGIDSSVVAHLLKEQEHEVIGVRFTLWTDPLAPPLAEILPSKCCNAQNIARADRVAKSLDIPLHILNLEEKFKKDVVDPFLNGYRKGLTPNPCIGCNRTIKFGKLLEFAKELGCEKLATGHYARVIEQHPPHPSIHRRPVSSRVSRVSLDTILLRKITRDDTRDVSRDGTAALGMTPIYHLLEAVDKSKDQSYFLYGLNQEQLSRVMFPLGNMFKRDVYALAENFGVPYDDLSYRESQDLCFFPEKTPKPFLKRHLKNELKRGSVVQKNDGKTIGTHEGVPLYTMGQRRMGIGGQRIPLEVVQKDYSSNTIFVDIKGKTKIKELKINSINWIGAPPIPNTQHSFDARTHSTGQKYRGKLAYNNDEGTFTVESPIGPQSPGQHLVLYREEEIMGGGIIEEIPL